MGSSSYDFVISARSIEKRKASHGAHGGSGRAARLRRIFALPAYSLEIAEKWEPRTGASSRTITIFGMRGECSSLEGRFTIQTKLRFFL
jgi:hypothetical protein